MSAPGAKQRLIDHLLTHSVRRGDFTLKSGRSTAFPRPPIVQMEPDENFIGLYPIPMPLIQFFAWFLDKMSRHRTRNGAGVTIPGVPRGFHFGQEQTSEWPRLS